VSSVLQGLRLPIT